MTRPSLALLRGINVGGKNILPMAKLRDIFAAAGCTQIATYIQSGNVIFTPPANDLIDLAALVKSEIAAFGLHVPVILRTASETERTLTSNPFLKRGTDPDWLHLMFLQSAPTTEQVAALDRARSSPDEFFVDGREIYLHLPGGAAKTKLTNAYFDVKLKTVSTQRNWRTVLKLAEMLTNRQ